MIALRPLALCHATPCGRRRQKYSLEGFFEYFGYPATLG